MSEHAMLAAKTEAMMMLTESGSARGIDGHEPTPRRFRLPIGDARAAS